MKIIKISFFILSAFSTQTVSAEDSNLQTELSGREQEIKRLSTITITSDPRRDQL